MTTPRWTDDDLQLAVQLAWQSGRDHTPAGLDAAVDDLAHTRLLPPPAQSYEQRVEQRITDMIRSAAPGEYMGGPVPWEPPRPVPACLADHRDRERVRDTAALEQALPGGPRFAENDWPAVHATVTASEWWRIWWDLADTTRARHPQLEPTAATLLGGRP